MKKVSGLLLGMVVLCGLAGQAVPVEEKGSDKPSSVSAASSQTLTPREQAKQQVINDLALMQNQEVRVIVLQQVLNREAADLRQSQALFCDQYKLDCDKWRKGLYRYDEKQGKFVEVPPASPSK